MTGYRLEREIVGWQKDADCWQYGPTDRRFVTVYEDDGTLHYPWGVEAFEQGRRLAGSLPFLCHEPDYQPHELEKGLWACVHCGDVVRPVWDLRS